MAIAISELEAIFTEDFARSVDVVVYLEGFYLCFVGSYRFEFKVSYPFEDDENIGVLTIWQSGHRVDVPFHVEFPPKLIRFFETMARRERSRATYKEQMDETSAIRRN